jgi:hypothetical protein
MNNRIVGALTGPGGVAVGRVRVTLITDVTTSDGKTVLTSVTRSDDEYAGTGSYVTRVAHRLATSLADNARQMLQTMYGDHDHDPAPQPEGITITREELERWIGRPIPCDQLARLGEAMRVSARVRGGIEILAHEVAGA